MTDQQRVRGEDGRLRSAADAGVVSRRTFLAGSGSAVVLSGAAVSAGEEMVAREPAEIVLTERDLRTTSDAEYVLVGDDPADATVIRRLETGIAGFRHVPRAVSGFEATDAESIPRYVESAVVALPRSISPGRVARVTEEWLAERFDATDALVAVDHAVGQFAEVWRSRTTAGWQDVFRVVHAGDGLLVFSVAYGSASAAFPPERAAAAYESIMRDRAFEPA